MNDDAEHKDTSVDHDGVLSAQDLGEEASVESTDPGSELEDRGQPAFFGGVFDIFAHVDAKVVHGEQTAEATLVVTIEQTADTSKEGDQENSEVLRGQYHPVMATSRSTYCEKEPWAHYHPSSAGAAP